MRRPAHNIRVLPVLFDPPSFRRPAGANKKYTPLPKSNDDMAAFARGSCDATAPGGSVLGLPPELPDLSFTSYQIWNKPNLPVYSGGNPMRAAYVAMLRTVGAAIKASTRQADDRDRRAARQPPVEAEPLKYIRRCTRPVPNGTFDTLGVNPYAPTAEEPDPKLKRIRGIMAKNGDSDASLWVTELGWSDVGPKAAFRAGSRGRPSGSSRRSPR